MEIYRYDVMSEGENPQFEWVRVGSPQNACVNVVLEELAGAGASKRPRFKIVFHAKIDKEK